jgi:hypothetical protein
MAANLFDAIGEFYANVRPVIADDVFDFNELIRRTAATLPASKRTDVFWPATINSSYDCDRKKTLTRIERIYTNARMPDPDGMYRMMVGSAIHEMLQNRLLGPSGIYFGQWRCACCRQLRTGYSTYPKELCSNKVVISYAATCEQETPFERETAQTTICADSQRYLIERGEPAWHYAEIRVKDEELNLSGRVDGVIFDSGGWYTVELKSTSSDAFHERELITINAAQRTALGLDPKVFGLINQAFSSLPKSAHITQASIYSIILQRMARAGLIPLDANLHRGALIVYFDRDSFESKTFLHKGAESAFTIAADSIRKIQHVVRSADREERTDPAEEAKRVDANRQLAIANIKGVCSSRTDERALDCPWRLVCFPYKDTKRNVVTHL